MTVTHVVVDSQGWWARNSSEINVLITGLLAGLTFVYVLLTRRLAKADTEALAAALEANRLNREANALTRQSLDLATRERIDAVTPAAFIYAVESRWSGDVAGTYDEPVTSYNDPDKVVLLSLSCQFLATTHSPVVVECEQPLWGQWSQSRYVLIPDNNKAQTQLVWQLEAPLVEWQRRANAQQELSLTFRTCAPSGGAHDSHRWSGVFSGVEFDGATYTLRPAAFNDQQGPWTQCRQYG